MSNPNAPAFATPSYLAGDAYSLLTTSDHFQVKSGATVASGVLVNAGGTSSAISLYDGTSATVTMTIASPGVITWTGHPFVAGGAAQFTTTGALPTGLTAGTTVYVSINGLTANTFEVADTHAHALAGTNTINTSGSQSGVHTGWDVTRLIATLPTTSIVNLPIGNNGALATSGLIAITTDGGGASSETVLYR